MTAPRQRPEAALAVIRIAMLSGVLVFGAVVWFLHRQPRAGPPAEGVAQMGRALPIVFGAVIAALVALRALTGRADAGRARALTVVGWAVGEFAALAGGAHYLLARDPQWYAVGVLILVASYVVLPIRRG